MLCKNACEGVKDKAVFGSLRRGGIPPAARPVQRTGSICSTSCRRGFLRHFAHGGEPDGASGHPLGEGLGGTHVHAARLAGMARGVVGLEEQRHRCQAVREDALQGGMGILASTAGSRL